MIFTNLFFTLNKRNKTNKLEHFPLCGTKKNKKKRPTRPSATRRTTTLATTVVWQCNMCKMYRFFNKRNIYCSDRAAGYLHHCKSSLNGSRGRGFTTATCLTWVSVVPKWLVFQLNENTQRGFSFFLLRRKTRWIVWHLQCGWAEHVVRDVAKKLPFASFMLNLL